MPTLATHNHLVTYPYQWGTGFVEPPAQRQVRLNEPAGDPTVVTKAWLHVLNLVTDDVYLVLMGLVAGMTLYVQDHDDHTTFLELLITGAPIDKGEYVELPVQYVSHGGTAVGNNQDVLCAFFAPAAAPPIELPLTPGPIIVSPWRQPRSCFSLLVTPPTEEPITVAEAKLRAGLDFAASDPREALVSQYIAAARNLVERETGLALLTQVRDIYFCPYDPAEPWPLPSLSTPLQTIVEIVPWTPAAPTPMAGMGMDLALGRPVRALQAVLPVATGVTYPGTSEVGARMRIVAGWPSKAALAAEVPTLVHAVGLLAAHMLTLGRDLAITGAVAAISETPQGYEDCIAPHRLMWVT